MELLTFWDCFNFVDLKKPLCGLLEKVSKETDVKIRSSKVFQKPTFNRSQFQSSPHYKWVSVSPWPTVCSLNQMVSLGVFIGEKSLL